MLWLEFRKELKRKYSVSIAFIYMYTYHYHANEIYFGKQFFKKMCVWYVYAFYMRWQMYRYNSKMENSFIIAFEM